MLQQKVFDTKFENRSVLGQFLVYSELIKDDHVPFHPLTYLRFPLSCHPLDTIIAPFLWNATAFPSSVSQNWLVTDIHTQARESLEGYAPSIPFS
jgi:hypothetical protein